MTAPKPTKPLSKGGRVFVWFVIVFVALIADGVAGRDALADGPVGTLTADGRMISESR